MRYPPPMANRGHDVPARTPRIATLVLWFGLGVFALVMTSRIQPAWNLDVVFYAGASHAQTERDPETVHRTVYAELGKAAPARQHRALTESSGYRRRVTRSSTAFAGQLPFYSAKPLYVSAITLERTLFGTSGVRSAFHVSKAGYVLLLLGVAAMSRAFVATPVAVLLAAAFGLGIPIVETAQLASPDMLCTALVVWTYVAFLRGSVWGGSLVGTLAVLTRPDAVVFLLVGVLVSFLVARPPKHRVGLLTAAGLFGAAAVLPSRLEGAYGWTMVMRQTFFGATTHLERLRQPLSWQDYVVALQRGLGGHMSLDHGGYWPYLAATVLGALLGVLLGAPRRELRAALRASSLCWIAAGLHVLAFPLIADRVLLPAYAMSLAVVAAAASKWMPPRKTTDDPAA